MMMAGQWTPDELRAVEAGADAVQRRGCSYVDGVSAAMFFLIAGGFNRTREAVRKRIQQEVTWRRKTQDNYKTFRVVALQGTSELRNEE